VKKLDLKALYIPDRKRILIDTELPSKKQHGGSRRPGTGIRARP
jgi:hypothetical protein